MSVHDRVNDHYATDDVYAAVLDALETAGIDPAEATVDDLAPIDQYHSGGLAGTVHLAGRLGIDGTTRVFDAGCGAGGPARWMAARRGCEVVGVDLAAPLVDAGRRLNDLLGLAERVRLEVASIDETEQDDDSFDAVWSQNVFMNVPEKEPALAELARILRPGGRAAIQQMVRLAPGELRYPVFWADDHDMDFIPTELEFRSTVERSPFELEDFRIGLPIEPDPDPPSPAMHPGVLMGLDAETMAAMQSNVAHSVRGGLIKISVAILHLPG